MRGLCEAVLPDTDHGVDMHQCDTLCACDVMSADDRYSELDRWDQWEPCLPMSAKPSVWATIHRASKLSPPQRATSRVPLATLIPHASARR